MLIIFTVFGASAASSDIIYIQLQKDQSLWDKSTELANELNADRYQIMHAIFKGNKDAFEDNNINKIQYDRRLTLAKDMIFTISPSEANEIVNRHIYCGC